MYVPKQLAVFPLPIFLLPNGRAKLRIFEPRYIRMVKQSAGSDGFVLSLFQQENDFSSSEWGAWVHIIDFETLSDGMLGITIEAKVLVNLSQFFYEEDKLLNAQIDVNSHWSVNGDLSAKQREIANEITSAYGELLEQQEHLAELYPEPVFDDICWIVARWLEVLPITPTLRKKLSQKDSFELALETVATIILGK